MRKASPKLNWKDLPKEALQSSLLDSAGGATREKKPQGFLEQLFLFALHFRAPFRSANLCRIMCEGSK